MEEPKHDEESLALEEQFGAPALDLNFPGEGRLIIPVDGRKVARQLKELSAQLDALGRPKRGQP